MSLTRVISISFKLRVFGDAVLYQVEDLGLHCVNPFVIR